MFYCFEAALYPEKHKSASDMLKFRRWMDGWPVILHPFNSITVISGWWADDTERLCKTEPNLCLRRFLPQAGLKLGTARSVGQCLNPLSYWRYKILQTKHGVFLPNKCHGTILAEKCLLLRNSILVILQTPKKIIIKLLPPNFYTF